jgi:membrane peptidoglycan carboxypeptidase
VCAAVPGFDVAGKTGTSRIPLASGGYSSSQHMASFVGFAPAETPRIASIVVLDNPRDVYGGSAAAPVFSEIMAAALRAQHVVPPTPSTNPPQWIVAAQAALQQGTPCSVPHGAPLANALSAERAAATAAAQAAAAAAKAKSKTSGGPASRGVPPATGTVPKTTTPPHG